MSKNIRTLIIILAAIAICALGVLSLGACGRDEPTPEIDDSWDRVQAAGKLVVGTAADYPPFEYWNEDDEIDGFDVALMDEIADLLGVEVEYVDMAFDGLGDALDLGEIDIAIAAISITPDREAFFDFSNVYLVSEDGFLAREGVGIDIDTPEDLAEFRVGVQRGTVHEDWLRDELVSTGLLPDDNLFVYADATDLTRDLTMNRLDLAMMDIQPALVAASQGGMELAGQGLNQMRLGIALPKGAEALREQIDTELVTLNNEGVIASLSRLYLGQAELLPTPTPGTGDKPVPTAPAPDCVDGLQFVEHPPGDPHNTQRPPGQAFTKVWRVKNSGTCTWNSSFRVVHVDGAQLGGGPTNVMGNVAPGQTYDIAVRMVAPTQPGTYQGRWQMENGQGEGFGERLPVKIIVSAPPTATPPPTQTPVPGIEFTVDRDQIKAGECVVFSWRVSNVQAIYFYAEGQRWQDGGVTGEGSSQECPPVTTTYYLRVEKLDGTVETREITVYVTPAVPKPVIEEFTVDPPGQITLGECVTLRWEISGQVSDVRIRVNEELVWGGAPIKGTYLDCPPATGTSAYLVIAEGPGGQVEQNHRTQVVAK